MTTALFKPEVQAILDRLQRGSLWLVETHAKLLSLPDGGVGTDMERLYLRGLDRWDSYDKALRTLFGFQGCVCGQGQRCPDDAPVLCRGCSERQEAFQL